jgi:hypothetical protein
VCFSTRSLVRTAAVCGDVVLVSTVSITDAVIDAAVLGQYCRYELQSSTSDVGAGMGTVVPRT